MNEIQIFNNDETTHMSSVEIAELTGKRHDNVMTDINNMIAELEGCPKKSGHPFQ